MTAQLLYRGELELAPQGKVVDPQGNKIPTVAQLECAALQVQGLLSHRAGIKARGIGYLPALLCATGQET
jgi:hypothetical protein